MAYKQGMVWKKYGDNVWSGMSVSGQKGISVYLLDNGNNDKNKWTVKTVSGNSNTAKMKQFKTKSEAMDFIGTIRKQYSK